ncbi:MAG: response regulator transcription factor [Prevotella sp.]|jgi:DNA-binding LytR/AlgR family response regulator|nr:response regulator transcription factor [Prevotella sp.]
MIIKCAIVDDEPLAASLLESYVNKTPYLELTGIYNSALTAMKKLRDNPAQLLFLDIQMPELTGIEYARLLTPDVRVIFTTAFPQYAIEGFKVNAIDYLLKPISYEDFLRSTEKALSWFGITPKDEPLFEDRVVFIKSEYKLQRVRLDDILYVEGIKDYLCFHLKSGETISSLMSMRKLEEMLPHPEFLRCHRSFMVRMPEVRTVDRLRIVFGDVFVPITENYRERVMQYIESHTIA